MCTSVAQHPGKEEAPEHQLLRAWSQHTRHLRKATHTHTHTAHWRQRAQRTQRRKKSSEVATKTVSQTSGVTGPAHGASAPTPRCKYTRARACLQTYASGTHMHTNTRLRHTHTYKHTRAHAHRPTHTKPCEVAHLIHLLCVRKLPEGECT